MYQDRVRYSCRGGRVQGEGDEVKLSFEVGAAEKRRPKFSPALVTRARCLLEIRLSFWTWIMILNPPDITQSAQPVSPQGRKWKGEEEVRRLSIAAGLQSLIPRDIGNER